MYMIYTMTGYNHRNLMANTMDIKQTRNFMGPGRYLYYSTYMNSEVQEDRQVSPCELDDDLCCIACECSGI